MKIKMFVMPETSGRYLNFVRKVIGGDYKPNDLIFYTIGDTNYIHPKLKIARFEKMGDCMKFRF